MFRYQFGSRARSPNSRILHSVTGRGIPAVAELVNVVDVDHISSAIRYGNSFSQELLEGGVCEGLCACLAFCGQELFRQGKQSETSQAGEKP